MTMFVSFLLAARYLELLARQRAAQALESALACLPAAGLARLLDDGRSERSACMRLRAGRPRARAGGPGLPGRRRACRTARTRADESLLSGESQPVPKQPRRRAGGRQREPGRAGDDAGAARRRRHAVRGHRLDDAQRDEPAPGGGAPGRPLGGALPVGGAAAGRRRCRGVERDRPVARACGWPWRCSIVTCPCALSLAAPAALTAAARGLARRGVMVQRLDAIEALAQAQHFFFDKTGTLTEDRLQLAAAAADAAGQAEFADAAGGDGRGGTLAAWSTPSLVAGLGRRRSQRRRPGRWTQSRRWPAMACTPATTHGGLASGRTHGPAPSAASAPPTDERPSRRAGLAGLRRPALAAFGFDEALRARHRRGHAGAARRRAAQSPCSPATPRSARRRWPRASGCEDVRAVPRPRPSWPR